MGWAGGSEIYEEIIRKLKRAFKDQKVREKIHACILPPFLDTDWDTVNECYGIDPAFDNVLKKVAPDWVPEDNDE